MAAAVYMCFRGCFASCVSRFILYHELRRFRVVGTIVNVLFDETPLRQRADFDDKTQSAATTICKIVQSEVVVSIILESLHNKQLRYSIYEIPVVTPLQHIERGTGQTLAAVLRRWLDLPVLADLRKISGIHWTTITADRASANDVCIDGLAAEFLNVWHLRMS